jgi:hypothetical protein
MNNFWSAGSLFPDARPWCCTVAAQTTRSQVEQTRIVSGGFWWIEGGWVS